MRIVGGLALALSALLLAGCVEYKEEIWLRADGSAKLRLDLSVKQVMGMDPIPDHDETFDEEDSSGRSWTDHADGYTTHHIEETIKGDFRETQSLSPGHVKLGKFNPDWYTIEPLGLGRYRVQRLIKMPDAGKIPSIGDLSGNPLAKIAEGFGKSMVEEAMAGHQVVITLHAPLILATNADEKQGLSTAIWRREVNSIARGDAAALNIDATVLLVDWMYVAAGGAVLLLLIVLMVAGAIKKRKKKPAQ